MEVTMNGSSQELEKAIRNSDIDLVKKWINEGHRVDHTDMTPLKLAEEVLFEAKFSRARDTIFKLRCDHLPPSTAVCGFHYVNRGEFQIDYDLSEGGHPYYKLKNIDLSPSQFPKQATIVKYLAEHELKLLGNANDEQKNQLEKIITNLQRLEDDHKKNIKNLEKELQKTNENLEEVKNKVDNVFSPKIKNLETRTGSLEERVKKLQENIDEQKKSFTEKDNDLQTKIDEIVKTQQNVILPKINSSLDNQTKFLNSSHKNQSQFNTYSSLIGLFLLNGGFTIFWLAIFCLLYKRYFSKQEEGKTKAKSLNLIPTSKIKFIKDDNNRPIVLGEGGFGRVYHMTFEGKDAAFKVPRDIDVDNPKIDMDEKTEEDLIKETNAAINLEHENIVQTYGINLKYHGILMEYMPKLSLFDFLNNKYVGKNEYEKLTFNQVYYFIKDITHGIQYLHEEKDAVHRDLKSLNILVGDNLRLKISDFGLTRFKVSSNKTSMVKTLTKKVGTPVWMAPEVMSENPLYTKKSDIFSMGVIFWEIFSRQIPWSDFNFEELGNKEFSKKLNNGERQDIPKDCPESFALLIGKCWKTRRKDRPSIDEVITEIDENENDLKGSNQFIKKN
jgi:iron-sulfur cluster repair protein YtfE (RIC family)